MMICERLTDRIPVVARGDAHWDAMELAHLTTCADCSAEWRLVSSAVALGRRTPTVAPELVARAVVDRLRTDHHRKGWSRRWLGGVTVLAAAAVVALIFWPRSGTGGAELVPVPVFLPELDSLTTPQLESVLGTLDAPLGSVRTLDAPDLNGLSDDQLSAVLRSMEG
ncbi:MAG: hypothetical protein WBC97_04160 [Gemmatimonadales bacterium]